MTVVEFIEVLKNLNPNKDINVEYDSMYYSPKVRRSDDDWGEPDGYIITT